MARNKITRIFQTVGDMIDIHGPEAVESMLHKTGMYLSGTTEKILEVIIEKTMAYYPGCTNPRTEVYKRYDPNDCEARAVMVIMCMHFIQKVPSCLKPYNRRKIQELKTLNPKIKYDVKRIELIESIKTHIQISLHHGINETGSENQGN